MSGNAPSATTEKSISNSHLYPMLKKEILFTALYILFFLQSCGSLLDLSGKGAKTTCLTLATGTKTITCNCESKQIARITIYKNKQSNESFGPKILDSVLQTGIGSFQLPFEPEMLDNCYLQIEIHLTDSHWRESYYIDTKPGDFTKPQAITARYFSH